MTDEPEVRTGSERDRARAETIHGAVAGARHFTFWRATDLAEAFGAGGWSIVASSVTSGSTAAQDLDGAAVTGRWIQVVARRP